MTSPPQTAPSASSPASRAHDRFWSKVECEGACWVWQGADNGAGYGYFRVGSVTDGSRRQVLAHRWAYEECIGPIPADLQLDHLCRNRRCVRPSHLEPVTQRENLLRGDTVAARHAAKTACPRCGSSYRLRSDGRRYCGACDTRLQAERRSR